MVDGRQVPAAKLANDEEAQEDLWEEDVEDQTNSNNNQAAGEATDSSYSKAQTKQTVLLNDPTLTTTTTMGELSQGIQTTTGIVSPPRAATTTTMTPKNDIILMEHEDLPMLAIGSSSSCELLNPWEPAVDCPMVLCRGCDCGGDAGEGILLLIPLLVIVAMVWLLLTPLWLAIALSRILKNRKRLREHEHKLNDLKDPTSQAYLERFANLANSKKGYIVFGKQQQQEPNDNKENKGGGGGGGLVAGIMLNKDHIPDAGGTTVQIVNYDNHNHNTLLPKSSHIAIARHGCWIDRAAPIAQFRSTHCRVALCTTATTTAGEEEHSSSTSTTASSSTKRRNQVVLMEKDLPVEWLVSHASSCVKSLLDAVMTTTVSNGDDDDYDVLDQMKIGQWYWFETQPQKVGEIVIS